MARRSLKIQMRAAKSDYVRYMEPGLVLFDLLELAKCKVMIVKSYNNAC